MKDTIIVDLDGTLCDCSHRQHHVQGKPKNWDAFYAGVIADEPNEAVFRVVERLRHKYEIIFCTGRPERCRRDTAEWLVTNLSFLSDDYTLLMRKDGDYRADYIVKQEMLDTHIDKERVLFVLEDRKQVVDMWRANGLTCFQVAEGNF